MLIDRRDFALIAQTSVRTPTGRTGADGKTALTPSVQFWSNPFGGFGFRGGLGVTTETISKAADSQVYGPDSLPGKAGTVDRTSRFVFKHLRPDYRSSVHY